MRKALAVLAALMCILGPLQFRLFNLQKAPDLRVPKTHLSRNEDKQIEVRRKKPVKPVFREKQIILVYIEKFIFVSSISAHKVNVCSHFFIPRFSRPCLRSPPALFSAI